MSYDISITALERGVRTWAKQLRQRGFTVEIDVFRTVPGGDAYYGPSKIYVEVMLEAQGFHFDVEFVAGGYGGLDERAIGGCDGWRAMKKEAERRLMKA